MGSVWLCSLFGSSPCCLHTFSSHCSSTCILFFTLFFLFYCYLKGIGKMKICQQGEERELQRKRIMTQCGEVETMRLCEIVARWLSMRILNRNIFFFFLFFLLSCLGSKCLYWFYIVGSHFGLSVLLFLSSFERSG